MTSIDLYAAYVQERRGETLLQNVEGRGFITYAISGDACQHDPLG